MKNFFKKGQINMIIAIIGAIGIVTASGLTAWATANGRVSSIDAKMQVVEERENNHYEQLKEDLKRMENKIDQLIKNK